MGNLQNNERHSFIDTLASRVNRLQNRIVVDTKKRRLCGCPHERRYSLAVGCGTGSCASTQAQTGADCIFKRWVAAFPLASLFALMAFACHVASYFIGFIGMITIR